MTVSNRPAHTHRNEPEDTPNVRIHLQSKPKPKKHIEDTPGVHLQSKPKPKKHIEDTPNVLKVVTPMRRKLK